MIDANRMYHHLPCYWTFYVRYLFRRIFEKLIRTKKKQTNENGQTDIMPSVAPTMCVFLISDVCFCKSFLQNPNTCENIYFKFFVTTNRKMMKKCCLILLATLTECCTAFLARVNHNLNVPDESIRKTRSMSGSLNLFGFGETTKEISNVAVAKNQLSEKSKVLMEKARNFAYNQSGFYSEIDEDVLSEEFVFRGPLIGPYNKKDYCKVSFLKK